METVHRPLDLVVKLLDLEPIEVNLFRGISPQENRQRVFGGQVAGQALVAAARTVDDAQRQVHSLHAYFLRPGDPSVPILYEVDRIRDGRSFTTRRVVAVQHGQAIFNLQASFHTPEAGLDHQLSMPDVPGPDDLPDFTLDHHDVACATNPLGVKGGGESGTVGALPVMVNAVVDALADYGVRDVCMPMTPQRVWQAIHAGS